MRASRRVIFKRARSVSDTAEHLRRQLTPIGERHLDLLAPSTTWLLSRRKPSAIDDEARARLRDRAARWSRRTDGRTMNGPCPRRPTPPARRPSSTRFVLTFTTAGFSSRPAGPTARGGRRAAGPPGCSDQAAPDFSSAARIPDDDGERQHRERSRRCDDPTVSSSALSMSGICDRSSDAPRARIKPPASEPYRSKMSAAESQMRKRSCPARCLW